MAGEKSLLLPAAPLARVALSTCHCWNRLRFPSAPMASARMLVTSLALVGAV